MNKTRVMDDSDASDDSISLTSTVASTKEESYEVECILAERKSKGVIEYLTAWKGYPETEHEWIPRENFNEDEVFIDWTNTQKRIANGLEKPFDVRAWEKRCKAIRSETERRKERRRVKRLRLSKQVESASSQRKQDGGIQSSESNYTPKRSDKRIKRRSVHQDSPPSSSTSSLVSSSSSEDSDRPLLSRQESENFTLNPEWTHAETITLEEGLRTKGPHWQELLGLYGRNGTINQNLKYKTPGNLYDKAKSIRQEFLDSGREPPEYLKIFSQQASRKESRTSTPNVCLESRDQSRTASKKSSRSTSADSMMIELRKKQRIPEGKIAIRGSGNNGSHLGTQPEGGSGAKEPSQISALPQVEREIDSRAPSAKMVADSAAVATAQLESAHTKLPESSEPMHGETARVTWSGTASASTARPPISNPPRLGAEGDGSTRPSSLHVKSKLRQIEPRKSSVTGDITAGWNAEPKQRKSNNWATKNPDPVDGQPAVRSYKLSVQNRIFKSRRDGRPPDPSRLIFIDPKTGKAPTTISTPSATPMVSRTPLQLHQEELTATEAEERQARDVENPVIVSTSEPEPSPQTIVQSHQTKSDEQKVTEPGKPISHTSESMLRPTTGNMADGPADIDRPVPPNLASPRRGPPMTAPLGPRIETEELAKMSLQDHTKHSISSAHPLNEASINTTRFDSLDNPLRFTLRVDPSQDSKIELYRRLEQNLVIGDIKFGVDSPEGIKVKLVGFGAEVKKLLLTIQSSPRTLDFLFTRFCLASEYKAYFPAESSDYLGSGSIVSYRQSASAVENIVETLASNLQGGLFFAQHYTMLIYPAGASAWAFLDIDLPSVHPGTILRFAVRKPLPLALVDVHRQPIARLTMTEPKRYAEIKTRVQEYPIQAKDRNINIVFRDMFEIDFDRLIAQNGDQQHPPTKIFFLCFIPQGCENYEPDPVKRSALRARTSEEHDLFIKFLQANGAEEIYSMQNIGSQDIESNGAWDYFWKNVKAGTIIFHDAWIRYDLVPRLGKHLVRGSVNVWKTSLSPMHPGEKHPHLVRLFPHGGVLLLTESLILYRPHESLRMLMWFRRVHVPARAPGTWKLAVRPRIREWLLDLIDAHSDSARDIFGGGIQIFADIYTEIYWLLQDPNPSSGGLMCHEWDYEVPTDEALIVSSSSLRDLQARKEWKGEGAETGPDDDNIRQNDDLLVQWFAEWAIANVQDFRKFHIILGYRKDHPFTDTAILAYEKAYGHLEVMTFEEACLRHKVTPQSKLDDMEAERRRRLKEHLPAKTAAAEKARKEEREAARLALEARMQMFRDVGATEEEVMNAGRKLLRDMGGSEREVEECKVDMHRVFGNRWWEGDATQEKNGETHADMVDTDTR